MPRKAAVRLMTIYRLSFNLSVFPLPPYEEPPMRKTVFILLLTICLGALVFVLNAKSHAPTNSEQLAATFSDTRARTERGEADAQSELGKSYFEGRGVAQDDTRAGLWWRKAADQGNAGGHNNLGVSYMEGRGVAQDYAQARTWIQKAVDQDLALEPRDSTQKGRRAYALPYR